MQSLNTSTQEAGEQPGLPSNFQASQSCDLTRSCLKNKNKCPDVPGFVMHTWHPSLARGRRNRRQRPSWATVNSRPTWPVCDLVLIPPQTQRKIPVWLLIKKRHLLSGLIISFIPGIHVVGREQTPTTSF